MLRSRSVAERTLINGINLHEKFLSLWNSGEALWEQVGQEEIFRLFGLFEPYYIISKDGTKISIENLRIKIGIEKSYYYGTLTDEEGTILLQNVEDGSTQIVFRGESFLDYHQKFSKFIRKEDLPKSAYLSLDVIAKPVLDISNINSSLNFKKISD